MKYRFVQAFLEVFTKFYGVHPALIDERHARIFEIAGIDPQELRHVLRRIRHFDMWPEVWKEEGDKHLTNDNLLGAYLSYYIGQRIVLQQTPIKQELYTKSVKLYYQLDHIFAPIRETFTGPGGDVAGILQHPHKDPIGTIIMLPGVTFTKEELHYFAETYLLRGWRVLRLDNPGYGETEGTLKTQSIYYPKDAIAKMRATYPGPLYLFGISFGGFITLKNSHEVDGAITISAPCYPHLYVHNLPSHSQEALKVITGVEDLHELEKEMQNIRLKREDLKAKALIFHGTKDRTVPFKELDRIRRLMGARATAYPMSGEGHSCPGKWGDIWGISLNWLADYPLYRQEKITKKTEPVLSQQMPARAAEAGG